MWTVIKLGGTSQCKKGYDNLLEIFSNNSENKFYIVLSAVSGVTNLLEKFTQTKDDNFIEEVFIKNEKLISDLEIENCTKYNFNKNKLRELAIYYKRISDDLYTQSEIIGFGEVLSTSILFEYVNSKYSSKVSYVDSYDIIKSKKETFKLYPLSEFYGDINQFNNKYYDKEKHIYIGQGFIASTPLNKHILLGRGGSDTTGALVANMLHANEYVVYTDVDGIYTTDPRICPEAKIIYKMDYNIVQELSAMGAKVMHPSSILPCMEKNIPIIIKNTFSDNNLNTIITKVNKQETKISAIALQKDVKLIKITSESMWNNYGFVFDIFRRFSERRIDVNIISTSQFTISTTCDEKNMVLIQDLIQDLEEKYIVEMIPKCAIVSLVTNNIPEIYKFLDFSEINHHLISIGATNNSISFVVDEDNSTDIVNSIHKYI
jgi:aspartate kinase